MLLSLHIENIALIRRLDIDFGPHFNVLTGETGAGKSILIDSIGLLLGDRFDRSLIRTGENEALVCGLIGGLPQETLAALSESGIVPDSDGCIQLLRTLTADGRSRARINGMAVSLTQLRSVGESAISILGQSDHQLLRDEEAYRGYLDRYAADEEALKTYSELYHSYTALSAEIRRLSMSEGERIRRVDMLSFQLKEIEALKLTKGEEERLFEREKLIKSAERIEKNARYAYTALKGAEKGNVSLWLEKSVSALEKLSDVVPEAGSMAEQLQECAYRIDDIAGQVYGLLAFHNDEDPEAELDKLETRLAAIERLKKKYGASVDEIIAYAEKIRTELQSLSGADDRIEELQHEKKKILLRLEEAGGKLHDLRAEAAVSLSGNIVETLRYLDMENVRFSVEVKRHRGADAESSFLPHGYDDVSFLISANKGEAAHSLAKVASGGELARIMLALQTAVSGRENVNTLIFDEIDTGVSGKTARKLGIKLLMLSRKVQVLCVTHSAQVASLSDAHYKISKHSQGERTETSVIELDAEGRLSEIARILGGICVTDAQRGAAADMIGERESILAGF